MPVGWKIFFAENFSGKVKFFQGKKPDFQLSVHMGFSVLPAISSRLFLFLKIFSTFTASFILSIVLF